MKNFKPFNELKKELLADPEVKKYYDDLGPEYELIRAVIDKRLKKKMSQQTLAKQIGTRQSAISRLESGEGNPSFKFLQKVAKALDSKLRISFQ
jgi:ribosome-binding protein aMBF1 (putative translation factor)